MTSQRFHQYWCEICYVCSRATISNRIEGSRKLLISRKEPIKERFHMSRTNEILAWSLVSSSSFQRQSIYPYEVKVLSHACIYVLSYRNVTRNPGADATTLLRASSNTSIELHELSSSGSGESGHTAFDCLRVCLT